MFNKKTKAVTWVLTLIMSFLTAISGKAAGVVSFDSISEFEIITDLRCCKSISGSVRFEVNKVLDQIEEEKYLWLPYLFSDKEWFYASENGHEELYYLWLLEKFDTIADLLDEEKSIMWKLFRFEVGLLEFVKEKNQQVYFYHEEAGCTAQQLRDCLTEEPVHYDFTRLQGVR